LLDAVHQIEPVIRAHTADAERGRLPNAVADASRAAVEKWYANSLSSKSWTEDPIKTDLVKVISDDPVRRQETRTDTGDVQPSVRPDTGPTQGLQAWHRRAGHTAEEGHRREVVPSPARAATQAALPRDHRWNAHWRVASAQMRQCRRYASRREAGGAGIPVSLTRRRSRPRQLWPAATTRAAYARSRERCAPNQLR
jgi:hypothetical protein